MQRKVTLFLIALFIILNKSWFLELRRAEVSSNEASTLSDPNVASLSDVISEDPNEAFLPEASEIVEYELVSQDENNFDDDYFSSEEAEEFLNSQDEIYFSEETILSSSENIKEEDLKDLVEKEVEKLLKEELLKISSQTRKLTPIEEIKEVETLRQDELVQIEPVVIEPILKEENVSKNENFIIEDFIPEEITSTEIVKTEIQDENPFGVTISKTNPISSNSKRVASKNKIDFVKSDTPKKDISFGGDRNPFVKAFSSIRPEKNTNIIANKASKTSKPVANISPEKLKNDLYRAYISDNQYLSTFEDIEDELYEDAKITYDNQEEEYIEEYQDDRNFSPNETIKDALDGGIDINEIRRKVENTKKDIERPSGPLKAGTRDVLEMKINFQEDSSAVSGESVNLIRSFAQIAIEQPTNSIEIAIPSSSMNNPDEKKLTARRLSLVSNILRDTGISDKQIHPVLSNRDINSFSFRVVSNDNYSTYSTGRENSLFEDDENIKIYNVMQW